MQINLYKDHEMQSDAVADKMIAVVKIKPGAVFCLATGDSPKLAYTKLVEKAAAGSVDFSRCTFVSLDEWVGISPQNEGSCRFFLNHYLFEPLRISPERIHVFDGLSADLTAECQSMNEFIQKMKGIDLMIVGIGMNGHIGFNEPGTPVNQYAHVIELDEATQTVGQKYFREATSIKRGITLGLKQVLEARELLLVANGIKKAAVIKEACEGPITEAMPASIIQKHPQALIMVDEEAGSLIKRPGKQP